MGGLKGRERSAHGFITLTGREDVKGHRVSDAGQITVVTNPAVLM